MTKIVFDDKEVVLPPDLTLALQTEAEQRQSGDAQVIKQASDLVTLVNARIDDLVRRMNSIESGEGENWAVPLQTEINNRILGDAENKKLANNLNTATNSRIDDMVDDIDSTNARVTNLEQEKSTYVKTGANAQVNTMDVTDTMTVGNTATVQGTLTVGDIVNNSDHPWTKVVDEGGNYGVWAKRTGDIVHLDVNIPKPSAVGNRTLGNIPSWCAPVSQKMFVIPGWTSTNSANYHLQVNAVGSNDTASLTILSAGTYSYSFQVTYDVGVKY